MMGREKDKGEKIFKVILEHGVFLKRNSRMVRKKQTTEAEYKVPERCKMKISQVKR